MMISAESGFGLENMALLRDTVMTIYRTGIVPERVRK
jgi:hypothetical protein